jgi:hypothetical protein
MDIVERLKIENLKITTLNDTSRDAIYLLTLNLFYWILGASVFGGFLSLIIVYLYRGHRPYAASPPPHQTVKSFSFFYHYFGNSINFKRWRFPAGMI